VSEPYEAILNAVVEGDDVEAPRLVEEALAAGLPALDILQQGVVAGITKTGELWKANEYFLPDVILSAEAFKAAMVPLGPRLKEGGGGRPSHKYVIGVVEGDMHDLGKGLVIALLQSSGFEVIDLGIDVPKARFVEAVKEHQPAIVGMGAYMTTTMLAMKEIIAEVGADAWGKDALDARQKALELVGG
jgi:methanogenic corrinoid protein MtbC1